MILYNYNYCHRRRRRYHLSVIVNILWCSTSRFYFIILLKLYIELVIISREIMTLGKLVQITIFITYLKHDCL